jgi:hypothetical protein
VPARSDTATDATRDTEATRDTDATRETDAGPEVARLVLTSDGPVLVSGPVDLELPDGTHVSSRRPMTAVCTCHRSRRYPFCDASHRTPAPAAPGTNP